MQMIDLMKRLAELDAGNPNVVKEGWNDRLDDPDDYERFANNLDPDDDTMGSDNDLKSSILDVLKNIYAGASTGEDMIDTVADELGVYYDAVKQSGDRELQRAYTLMREKGADAEANPQLMAKIAQQAMSMIESQGMAEGLEECGMMGSMPPAQPHTPASINMTAASGEELSAMLKDIMTLAGQSHMHEPEPLGGADGVAVVDVEPAGDGMGPPEMGATDSMRSVLDRMNDVDDMGDDDEEDDESVSEWDNTPDPETTGYEANVPTGNDMHKEKHQYPAAQRGDNAMAATYESLMAEYKKFIAETKTD